MNIATRDETFACAVILHDVRSVHNVGAILRTAEAAGVASVYMTGITPTPVDRFGRTRNGMSKTALGAEEMLHWEYEADPVSCIARMREKGYTIAGVEQDMPARDYRDHVPSAHTAFVFGNEVKGIPPEVIEACDTVLEIPMHGRKASLNVSVAAGIVLFRHCG